MKRAVITGMGVVSPLGNTVAETLESLKATRSGIKFQPSYEAMGLRSQLLQIRDYLPMLYRMSERVL